MKKNAILITIAIVTVLCIIVGTTYHYSNIKKSVQYVFGENETEWNDENSYTNTLESFNKIDIDSKIMEINIKEGSNYSFQTSFTKASLEPQVKVENGELFVKQNSVRKSVSGLNNCTITITVPKDTDINEITIESNISEVNIDNLKANNIEVENNIGEISIDNVSFNKLKADSNIGEVKVQLPDSFNDYNIKTESNIGIINIDGKDFKKSYNQKGSTSKEIKIETNIGEIKIY